MKKAAYYARVSTANQEQEETIGAQIAAIEERIKLDGNTLLAECRYTDNGWTGSMLPRPELDRLRSDAREGKFEVLYVYDRGRLARIYHYQEIVLEELADRDVEFISLHDAKVESEEDKAMQGMQGIFHQWERAKISERFRLGKLRKVRDGKLLGYNPLYGYDYHPKVKGLNPHEGYFTVNETEARVIIMICEWVGNEGVAIRQVIRRLHDLKIPPKKQKRSTWTKGPIARILREESYTGRHYYNKNEAIMSKKTDDETPKYRRIKKTGRRVRPKEEWMPIEIPRIISDELFEKVQKQLELNKKFSSRNTKNDYLLTGLIKCSCGQSRTGEGVKGHLYYRCTDRLHRFPIPRECMSGGVNVKVLDSVAWDKIKTLLTNPKLIEKQAIKWLENKKPSEEAEVEKLKIEEFKLMTEEKRYTKAYGDGVMPEGIYKESMQSVQERRKALSHRQGALMIDKPSLPQIEPKELVKRALAALEGFNFEDRKYIVRKLIENVIATPEEATIWGHIPVTSDSYVGLSHEDRDRWITKRR